MFDNAKSSKSDKTFWIILVIIVVLLICMRLFVLDMIWIRGDSMLPTLLNGEMVLAEKISKNTEDVSYGDIVIVKYPDGEQCVKRIIGLEGDRISINNGQVSRNGEQIAEPYTNGETFENTDEVIVPYDGVFVMGDNRAVSRDSRDPFIGTLAYDSIIGNVICVIFPFDMVRAVN